MDRASNFLVGLGLVLVCRSLRAFSQRRRESVNSELKSLATLTPGQEQRIENFPVGASRSVAIRLRPAQIYSSDAHVYVIDADGKLTKFREATEFFCAAAVTTAARAWLFHSTPTARSSAARATDRTVNSCCMRNRRRRAR